MKKKTVTLMLFLVTSFIAVFSKNPEKLVGISLDIDKKEMTISVVSTGCTNKNDFELICKDGILTVNRLKPDFCKAIEEVVTFTYSFASAKIDTNKPFTISNKFIANPYLAKIK
jgi:hypothetical protein